MDTQAWSETAFTARTTAESRRATLPVVGLGRGADPLLFEHALERVPGVAHAYVNAATEMAYVQFDPLRTTLDDLQMAIESAAHRTVRKTSLPSSLDTQRGTDHLLPTRPHQQSSQGGDIHVPAASGPPPQPTTKRRELKRKVVLGVAALTAISSFIALRRRNASAKPDAAAASHVAGESR